MKNLIRIIILVVLVFGAYKGLEYMREQKPEVQEKEVIRPVKTVTLNSNGKGGIWRYYGTLQGGKRVDLSFRVSGPIRTINVDKGASVKKGQLLATLDPRDYQNRLKQARSSQAQAQAQYNDAQANFKRYENLYKQKVVPRATYDTYKTQMDVAKSALNAAVASTKTVRDSLRDTELHAPFDGVIVNRMVENFQDITAKQTIFSLQDISVLEIVFNIPDIDVLLAPIPNVKNIEELKSKQDLFSINARFEAIPDKTFPLTLKEISAQANAATNTYPVTATMPRQNDIRLLPGMAVTVEVDFNSGNNVANEKFFVPSTAILSENNKNFVWLFDNGIAKKIPVKIGSMNNDSQIEISSPNLKNNDLIITAGVYFLHDNQKIRLLEE